MNNLIQANISFQYMKEKCSTIEDLVKLKKLYDKLNNGKDIFVLITNEYRFPTAEEIVNEVIKDNRKIIIK